jgi:hypothetical protein
MWNGKVTMRETPELYSFTNRTNITVRKAKEMDDLHEIFQLPLTNEAFQQYLMLRSELANLALNTSTDI